MSKVKGLIVLVFDTLRSDYRSICNNYGINLTNFSKLRKYAPITPKTRCGSFPTTPMRTDLFTGRLAFLSDEWALPKANESTLINSFMEAGFTTSLVTDNYVITIPRVGGMMLRYFDSVDLIRGSSSDPWVTPTTEMIKQAKKRAQIRPTRYPMFEAQFIANTRNWLKDRKSPYTQVFESATRQLETLSNHDQFLLWVDCFGPHEPWIPYEWVYNEKKLSENVIFPPYKQKEVMFETQLKRQKRYYAQRIKDVDKSMDSFIQALEHVMRNEDVGLLVLSDHGFLFGEYGYIGKPAETALPPELHSLVCYMSPNITNKFEFSNFGLQPHLLHSMLKKSILNKQHTIKKPPIHLFGRNSPRSDYLSFATDEGIGILSNPDNSSVNSSWIKWENLNKNIKLDNHKSETVDLNLLEKVNSVVSLGKSQWLAPFKNYLNKI